MLLCISKNQDRGFLLTIEIRNRIRSALCCRVDAVLDNMLMELAVPSFDEGHSAPVRYAPKRRADYRADEISCT
jgi:hypothetical protein